MTGRKVVRVEDRGKQYYKDIEYKREAHIRMQELLSNCIKAGIFEVMSNGLTKLNLHGGTQNKKNTKG